MTPEEISAAIATLEKSLASGTASLEYEGRRITYRSPSEIMAGLNYFRGLASQGGGVNAPASADRGSYASFSRD